MFVVLLYILWLRLSKTFSYPIPYSITWFRGQVVSVGAIGGGGGAKVGPMGEEAIGGLWEGLAGLERAHRVCEGAWGDGGSLFIAPIPPHTGTYCHGSWHRWTLIKTSTRSGVGEGAGRGSGWFGGWEVVHLGVRRVAKNNPVPGRG